MRWLRRVLGAGTADTTRQRASEIARQREERATEDFLRTDAAIGEHLAEGTELSRLRSLWDTAAQREAEPGDLVIYRDAHDESYRIFVRPFGETRWLNPDVYRILEERP